MMWKSMLISALLLGLFAVVGTGLVASTYYGTAERIAQNERDALLRNLHSLVDPAQHNNDIYADRIAVSDRTLLGSPEPVQVYRARQDGRPIALVLTPVAPDGYNGDIRLLVAINYNARLAGVRVLSHHETPGLGDAIELEKSDWIRGFEGRSLSEPDEEKKGWHVRKDGGHFDQFTGATITPRAIVKAVYNTLKYYQAHRDALFETPADNHDS